LSKRDLCGHIVARLARAGFWLLYSSPPMKLKSGMGFRNLWCFNKALLAKQGCRLIQNLNNFAGQILKAILSKYNFFGSQSKKQTGTESGFLIRRMNLYNFFYIKVPNRL